MQQLKQKLEHVKEDASKLISSTPKGPLVPPVAASIPRPRPPAQLPTADELHLTKQAQRVQEVQRHDEEINSSMGKLKDSTQAPQERAKQLWGVLRGGVGKTIASAAAGASRVVYDTSSNYDQNSFREAFGPLTGPSTQYLNSFSCTVMHQQASLKCVVHVSSTHVCFDGTGLLDVLPLSDIASIIPSISLRTTTEPLFYPVPDPRVKPTALQIFTTKNTVIQLSSITYLVRHLATQSTGAAAFNLLYAEVDRAWRLVSQVPQPNVDYSS